LEAALWQRKKREFIFSSGVENYTVFVKNSIAFPRFGSEYHRNNMPATGKPCFNKVSREASNLIYAN